jgi:arylsulfatase A-like enzyme
MKVSLVLLILLALSNLQAATNNKTTNHPNVIVVITDDQGYGDLGCHGNNIIKTPHIDMFYKESVHFTNFHVSPTCAPTRSAIMTGRYSNRVGVWHTIAGRSLLWEDEVTMADIFSSNGYVNGLFGKWHLGDNYPFRPEDRGFHEVVVHGGGGITQGPDYWGNDYFDDSYRHNGKYKKYEGYCSDVFFNEAMRFIEKNRAKPFFCMIATNAPHDPLNVPAKYHEMYKDEQNLTYPQHRFYGMITNIDDNFQRLLLKLKDLDLEENTILIFMTDNGTAYGIRTIEGKQFGNTGGMRGAKNSEYEGGHRVPFFIRYPAGNITGGKDIQGLSAHIDLLPTFIELCGLDNVPQQKSFDGISLMPLLEGDRKAWKQRLLVVDSQRRRNLVKWRKSAVMYENWRLVNGTELYNLDNDPMQKIDIADDQSELVKKLRTGYNNWWRSFIDEGVNERYAYIQAGSDAENPLRISAHDMHTESTLAHSQHGALLGLNPLGIFKIEILEEGEYSISLCRYPRESGLTFESPIAAVESNFEIYNGMPAAKPLSLQEASLSIAQYDVNSPVSGSDKEVAFDLYLQKGKYDLDAYFTDNKKINYPPYYIYIKKKDL